MLPLMKAGWILLVSWSALADDGEALFARHCSTCHRPASATRAPLRETLSHMSRQAILAALETGSMKTEGAALTPGQRRDVAEFLSNVSANVEARTGFCA